MSLSLPLSPLSRLPLLALIITITTTICTRSTQPIHLPSLIFQLRETLLKRLLFALHLRLD